MSNANGNQTPDRPAKKTTSERVNRLEQEISGILGKHQRELTSLNRRVNDHDGALLSQSYRNQEVTQELAEHQETIDRLIQLLEGPEGALAKFAQALENYAPSGIPTVDRKSFIEAMSSYGMPKEKVIETLSIMDAGDVDLSNERLFHEFFTTFIAFRSAVYNRFEENENEIRRAHVRTDDLTAVTGTLKSRVQTLEDSRSGFSGAGVIWGIVAGLLAVFLWHGHSFKHKISGGSINAVITNPSAHAWFAYVLLFFAVFMIVASLISMIGSGYKKKTTATTTTQATSSQTKSKDKSASSIHKIRTKAATIVQPAATPAKPVATPGPQAPVGPTGTAVIPKTKVSAPANTNQ
jgi:hypothetical protein